MAQQTQITSLLALFFAFGTMTINCDDIALPIVVITPKGRIYKTVGEQLTVTCTINISTLRETEDIGPERLPGVYKKFYFVNCTSLERKYTEQVSNAICNRYYDVTTHSCTYNWTGHYDLNSKGEYEFGCFNEQDRIIGCQGGNLLQLNVSRPALPTTTTTPSTTTVSPTTASTTTPSTTTVSPTTASTTTPSTTTVSPTTASTITRIATTTSTTTQTRYGNNGSANSVTAENSNFTSASVVSPRQTRENRLETPVNTVSDNPSTVNQDSTQRNSNGNKDSQVSFIAPPVAVLTIAALAALAALAIMYWKCRRRRPSESMVLRKMGSSSSLERTV